MTQANDPLGLTGVRLANKYVLSHAVGEGGAGIVYRAQNDVWNVPVAVKFLVSVLDAAADVREAMLESFMREGKLLAELSTRTAAIVAARDLGVHTLPDGRRLPYLVLEWAEGKSLDEVLVGETSRRLAPRELGAAISLLEPVAGALTVAHRMGIVHRDIKPENMILIATGSGDTLKIFDFGIAKEMGTRQPGVHQTGTMATAFTPHYGAPEQFSRSYGETGPWTDVFAMALVVLEVMRGGQRAFAGNDFAELGSESVSLTRRPTPLSLGLRVSDDVESVFARALSVQPEHRYQDMEEFWSSLRMAVSPAAAAWRPSGVSLPPLDPDTILAPRSLPAGGQGSGATIVRAAWAGGVLLIVAASVAAAYRITRVEPATPVSASSTASASSPPPVASVSAAPAVVEICPPSAVPLPGGRFQLGEGLPAADQGPYVNVDAFCLDRYEVSVLRYGECVKAGRCAAPKAGAGCHPIGDDALGDHPINCVTQGEAAGFCSTQGMSLPTEAQWEAAATRRGRGFPGEQAPTAALFATGATKPGGAEPQGKTPEGVSDLLGNVAEWTSDWHAPYVMKEQRNPSGAAAGTERVVRGGSFAGVVTPPDLTAVAPELAAQARAKQNPQERRSDVGFRCATTVK